MRDTRTRITAAADRLFYREGFAATGIDRLVGEARVALGTLYRHFGTRSDIVVGALYHRDAAFQAKLTQKTGSVLALFDLLAEWSAERGGNGCFFLRAASAHPRDAAVRDAALAHKRAYLDLIRQRLLDDGWDAEQATRLAPIIFLLLEGAVAAAFTLGADRAIAEARTAAATLFRATRSKI